MSLDGIENPLYFKRFSSRGENLQVIVEFTPGDRRRFYVEDPPESFRKAAHNGRCLTSRGLADGDRIFHLHFSNKPSSLADGINTIKKMLSESA